MAIAGIGFLFAAVQTQAHLRLVWPESRADERARVTAIIESIPEARGKDWAFDAMVRIEAPRPGANDLHVRMISRDSTVRPHAGERWRLLISLRPPRATFNPGAVDHERLLFHDRIHALGTVVSARTNHRIDSGHRPLTALREKLTVHIGQRVADRDASALISALAVGATGAMSREQWRVFNVTGTTHLVAISGLHVTLFAVVMFAIARRLWSLLLWRWVALNRDSFAAIFGLTAATCYAVLSGLSVPTQRTLIMLAAWLAARSMARASTAIQPLAIALLAVLLLDPFAPLAPGFWLSFGAMGAILFVTQTRIARHGALREAIAVQFAITVTLMPLTLACFGSISVIGPVANAVAIPFMSWLLVPVVLAGLLLLPIWPSSADGALACAEFLHNLAWPWLAAAADSSMAVAYASPPPWWYALAMGAAFVALAPWPFGMRIAAVLCVLPFTWASVESPRRGELEMTALDAGRGTAIVVVTHRHALVFGTGESYGTQGSRAENIVVPFLRSRGVRAIDTLVVAKVTKVTADGITALLASVPVRTTLLGGPAMADFDGAQSCVSGTSWNWDGIRFEVGESCDLRIVTSRGSIRVATAATTIIDSVGTEWVIVSGRSQGGNQSRAFDSLAERGARILATGDMGALRVMLDRDGGPSEPVGLRALRRAVWRAQSAGPPTWK